MLKKLIKYDLKYGAKIFIVIHALLWIAAIFGRVFFLDRIDFDAPTEQLVSVLICPVIQRSFSGNRPADRRQVL